MLHVTENAFSVTHFGEAYFICVSHMFTPQMNASRIMLLQAIAFIIGIAAVCYSVITTCVESRAMDLEAQRMEDSELLPYRPEFFHAIFGLASAYLCMLYISWNLDTLPSLSGDGKFQVGFCLALDMQVFAASV